jgi:hypothetical protein
MLNRLLTTCLVAGAIASVPIAAHAQQTVHGLAGKVTAIYPATNMIKVATDDGSGNMFEIMVKADVPLNFQKGVKALTTPAATFNKKDDQVVVFYYGDDQIRTAVAVEDLGTAPLVKTAGTLIKLDKHDHTITVRDSSGADQVFHIDAHTVGEATSGVVEGKQFDADKGAKVRVVATNENGTQTALFIRAMTF